MKKKYYAYYLTESGDSGILNSWNECKAIVDDKKSRYKSFTSFKDAEDWLLNGAVYENKKGKSYYAYYLNESRESGILETWGECQKIIEDKRARYKSFPTYEEAKKWLDGGAIYENKKEQKEKLKLTLEKDAIYFDAGTGRGDGVEVRITDYMGNSLIDKTPHYDVNEYGNINVGRNKTNNYGELLGLSVAIDVAISKNIKKIFGDSDLVLSYWSKGKFHPENLEKETVELIKNVILKRKRFEDIDGVISHISGDINPADLGFHK